MKTSASLIICAAFALHFAPTQAEVNRYVCTIEHGYSLEDSGLRRNRRVKAALESLSFEIDRTTGVVAGPPLRNRGLNPVVVNRGSGENSFQAYWIVSGAAGNRVRFIEVQEFVNGPDKPFRAVVQNWTYTGTCT